MSNTFKFIKVIFHKFGVYPVIQEKTPLWNASLSKTILRAALFSLFDVLKYLHRIKHIPILQEACNSLMLDRVKWLSIIRLKNKYILHSFITIKLIFRAGIFAASFLISWIIIHEPKDFLGFPLMNSILNSNL